jgi:DnaJ-class molecular chaperone
VTVHVQPHPWFRREGDDLVIDLTNVTHPADIGIATFI